MRADVLPDKRFDLSSLAPRWAALRAVTARVLGLEGDTPPVAEHELDTAQRRPTAERWRDVPFEMSGDIESRLAAWCEGVRRELPLAPAREAVLLAVLHAYRLRAQHPAWRPSSRDLDPKRADRDSALDELAVEFCIAALNDAGLKDALLDMDAAQQFAAAQLALMGGGDEQLPGAMRAGAWNECIWADTPPEGETASPGTGRARWLLPLAAQWVSGSVHLQPDGRFDPAGTGPTWPLRLRPRGPDLDMLRSRVLRLLDEALQSGVADGDAALAFVQQHPRFVPLHLMSRTRDDLAATPALSALAAHARAWLDATLAERPGFFAERSAPAFSLAELDDDAWSLPGLRLVGVTPLLRFGQWIERTDAPDNQPEHRWLRQLAWVQRLDSGETFASAAKALRALKPATLEHMLGDASSVGRGWILAALGHEALEPMRQWATARGPAPQGDSDEATSPTAPNDVPMLRARLDAASPAQRRWFVDVYLKRTNRTWLMKLVDAVAGHKPEALLHSALVKHSQDAIGAIGALPLPSDEPARSEACATRYLQLRQVHADAAKYGAQRSANQRAAAMEGLALLATHSGHGDLGSLEWAMEAQQGDALRPWFEPRAVGDYRIHLSLAPETLGPTVVNAKGKLLGATPAALKKDADWLALKAQWDALKEQRRRFIESLERRMTEQTPLTRAQLAESSRHPLMHDLVQRLVWRDASGQIGLLQFGDTAGALHWLAPEGAAPLSGEVFTLVHPWHLFQAGTLAAWQRWAVQRKLVQPFKQVFRELYVPTPAEVEAGEESMRYAGRRIRTRVAAGILKNRGWAPSAFSEDLGQHRRFGRGLTAHMAFRGDTHYFTEGDELDTDRIAFARGGAWLRLTEVPPEVFSEAMRDIDLVIARAIVSGGDEYGSTSSIAARRALIEALRPALGAERITLHERHVGVQGRRASYRVHLASAHIHIEPGAYLCVVPDLSAVKPARTLRLPFEEDDARTAEIMSKLLLLMDDDKIKDGTITAQIEAALRGPQRD